VPRELPVVYEDVTDRTDVPDPAHLDVVAGYEAIGYRQVARILGSARGGIDAFVRDYSDEHRDALRVGLSLPSVLLLSADDLVLVHVAWFYGFPAVIASTGMADGSLVETHRRWDDVPPWPKRAERVRRRARLDGEMRRPESRGRSIHVVEGDDPASLDAAHRGHVSRARSTPVPSVSSPAELVREVEHRFRGSVVSADRFVLVQKLAGALVTAVGAIVLLALLATQPWPVVVAGAVVVALLTVLLLPRLYFWILYAQWYRPRYRARR
jgi:hypothetical protein